MTSKAFKTLNNYTKQELLSLDTCSFKKEKSQIFDEILAITQKNKIHSSGFRLITLIGVRKKQPVGIITRSCDDLNMFSPLGQVEIDVLSISGAMRFHGDIVKFVVSRPISTVYITLKPTIMSKDTLDLLRKSLQTFYP